MFYNQFINQGENKLDISSLPSGYNFCSFHIGKYNNKISHIMKAILFILLTSYTVTGQVSTNFRTGVSLNFLNFDRNGLNNKFIHYQVDFGLQLYQKFNISFEVGYMINQKLSYLNTGNMKTLSLGLNVDYRFIKNKLLSPKVVLSAGGFPYSTLKDKYVYSNLAIDLNESTNYRFMKWNYYFNTQFFLSIKMKDFYLDLGCGIPYISYEVDGYYYSKRRGFGWNVIAKFSYVFGQ